MMWPHKGNLGESERKGDPYGTTAGGNPEMVVGGGSREQVGRQEGNNPGSQLWPEKGKIILAHLLDNRDAMILYNQTIILKSLLISPALTLLI